MTDERDEMPTLSCKKCGYEMELLGVEPKAGSLPKLLTFRCRECGHVHTIEREEG